MDVINKLLTSFDTMHILNSCKSRGSKWVKNQNAQA